MTSGDGAGTADGAPRRLPRPLWWAYAAALVTVGLVTATSFWVESDRFGRPVPIGRLLVMEATSISVIFGLSIPLFAATVRLSLAGLGWPAVIAVHAAGAIAFSLAHVVGMSLLRWAVFAAAGESWSFGPFWQGLVYEMRKDVLVYAGLVTGVLLWLKATASVAAPPVPVPVGETPAPPSPNPEPAVPAAPDRIEIRDGTRRIWLTPQDILWIEAAGNYVDVHTAERSVLWRRTLSAVEGELAGRGFQRIHRSRLVNLRHVTQAATNDSGDFTLTLSNGATIGGARRWREAFDKSSASRSAPDTSV